MKTVVRITIKLSMVCIVIATVGSAYVFLPRHSSGEEHTLLESVVIQPISATSITADRMIKVEQTAFELYTSLATNFYPHNVTNSNEAKFTLSQNDSDITVQRIPNRVNVDVMGARIESIIGDEQANYGVYVYDLVRKTEVSINADVIFPPMSISKLPVGVMMMREIDKGTFTLDDQAIFDNASLADPTNVLTRDFIGVSFAIADYLRFLIIDSDNSSIRKLENLMGGNLKTNELAKAELGVEHFFRQPHDATAKDVGTVFKGLYYGTYLSEELNSYFINLLRNTHWSLQDGIPVGVPEEYRWMIAHKTGQGSSSPGYIWEDSGIVYGPQVDYVLVILNDHVHIPTARYKIQEISRVVWEAMQQ